MNNYSKRCIRILALLSAVAMSAQTFIGCNGVKGGTETLPPDISIEDGPAKETNKYNESISSEGTQSSTTHTPETNPAPNYTYKIDISKYLGYIDTTEQKYLKLVNKTHPINKSYSPEKKLTLDKSITLSGKEVILEYNAAKAVEAMIAEMRACGFKNIYVTSGFRTYEYQMSLYNNYFAEEKSKHPTESDAEIAARVLKYSAYPGTSEHQSGLCCDLFVSPGMSELVNYGSETSATWDIGFAESEDYKWLLENAHKFGFILRYEKAKENITGYSYESWHYRFVGRDIAKKIHDSGKCLEEYLGITD